VEAESEARLTTLALRQRVEPVATFWADSPAQAERAKRTLADLGDVDFEDRDFEPKWFDPAEGIAAIDGLLEHAAGTHRVSPAVRTELELLRCTLDEARRRSCAFYLAEVAPGEELGFAGTELEREAG
jgi:hypothetical protein